MYKKIRGGGGWPVKFKLAIKSEETTHLLRSSEVSLLWQELWALYTANALKWMIKQFIIDFTRG